MYMGVILTVQTFFYCNQKENGTNYNVKNSRSADSSYTIHLNDLFVYNNK